MKNPKEIIKIAESRIAEAKILSAAGYYEGAFYLAGYSIEMALKAKICLHLDIPNLFDDSKLLDKLRFKTHDIITLLLLSGIRKKFETEMSKNVPLYEHWNLISTTWNEKSRYDCCGTKSKQEAEDLITAISDNLNGVLTWILNN
jgi:HEPN domain-containing protein